MPAEHSIPDDGSRRKVIVVVAVIAAVFIGGFFYLLLRKSVGVSQSPKLENAIRPGSPEWEKYGKLIVRDDPEADESPRALGDIVMTLRTTMRNFTGRTITGLEMKAAVVDHQNQPVKQRTVVIIPAAGRSELDPNKTMLVSIVLDGFTETDDRANITMEVTGFRFR